MISADLRYYSLQFMVSFRDVASLLVLILSDKLPQLFPLSISARKGGSQTELSMLEVDWAELRSVSRWMG